MLDSIYGLGGFIYQECMILCFGCMKLGFTCLMHDLVICPQVCLSLCLNMRVKWLMRMIVMQLGAMQTLVGACT